MKKIMIFVMSFVFYGCAATNPPAAPEAKGQWHTINTDVESIKKGTF